MNEAYPVKIRASTPDDYPSIADIHNAIYSHSHWTAEALAQTDQRRDPKCQYGCWAAVLDQDKVVVGFGRYEQSIFDYHPQKFTVVIEVHPDYWRRGVGTALYEQVIAGLQPFDPRILRADGYANLPEGVRFMERRGFREVFRETPLHLDVCAFDPAPYIGLEARLRAQGIEIKTLRDLESDPHRDRKAYDLTWEVWEDVPKEAEIPPMDFDDWAAMALRDPLIPHDGYFIAVHGDEHIGMSVFVQNPGDDTLVGGLVGVKRPFRNRGVALAMQVRAIAYAREHGHALIKTSTSITNMPMRAVYQRVGFVRQPDWIQLEKVCQ